MKLPIITTAGHQGRYLIIDVDKEALNVHETSGLLLGNLPWASVVEQVLAGDDPYSICPLPRAPAGSFSGESPIYDAGRETV